MTCEDKSTVCLTFVTCGGTETYLQGKHGYSLFNENVIAFKTMFNENYSIFTQDIFWKERVHKYNFPTT